MEWVNLKHIESPLRMTTSSLIIAGSLQARHNPFNQRWSRRKGGGVHNHSPHPVLDSFVRTGRITAYYSEQRERVGWGVSSTRKDLKKPDFPRLLSLAPPPPPTIQSLSRKWLPPPLCPCVWHPENYHHLTIRRYFWSLETVKNKRFKTRKSSTLPECSDFPKVNWRFWGTYLPHQHVGGIIIVVMSWWILSRKGRNSVSALSAGKKIISRRRVRVLPVAEKSNPEYPVRVLWLSLSQWFLRASFFFPKSSLARSTSSAGHPLVGR